MAASTQVDVAGRPVAVRPPRVRASQGGLGIGGPGGSAQNGRAGSRGAVGPPGPLPGDGGTHLFAARAVPRSSVSTTPEFGVGVRRAAAASVAVADRAGLARGPWSRVDRRELPEVSLGGGRVGRRQTGSPRVGSDAPRVGSDAPRVGSDAPSVGWRAPRVGSAGSGVTGPTRTPAATPGSAPVTARRVGPGAERRDDPPCVVGAPGATLARR